MNWFKRWSRARHSRARRSGAPPPPTPLDNEIKRLGGSTMANDLTEEMIQLQKAPISREERIVELSRVNGSLREQVAFLTERIQDAEDFGYCVLKEVNSLVVMAREIIRELEDSTENSTPGDNPFAESSQ